MIPGTDDFSVFVWFGDSDEQQRPKEPASTHNTHELTVTTLGLYRYYSITDLLGIFAKYLKNNHD